MAEAIRLSVIIPVCNAAAHLRQCLDSVCSQPVESMEIICVDDGSVDESWEILQEYGQKDKRVQLLRQENLHAGIARNNGLARARGEYIHFLDADDWLEPEAYKGWLALARSQAADICIGYYYTFDAEKAEKIPKPYLETEELWQGNFAAGAGHLIHHYPMPWNKLYRREFLLEHEISFDDLLCANDRYFFFQAIRQAQRVVITHARLLNYRIGQASSLIGETRLRHYDCHFRSFELIWELFKDAPQEISSMVMDVSMEDFFSFYQRARGTEYEEKIRHELYGYVSGLDLDLLEGIPLAARWWYRDFMLVMAGEAHPLIVREVSRLLSDRKGGQSGYIFPYHLFRPHDRIVLYGAGEVGQAFYHQGRYQGFVDIVALVDGKPKTGQGVEILPAEALKELDFDYVLIAVRFEHIAGEIRKRLLDLGVEQEKIKWDGMSYEREDFYRNAFYPRWQGGRWQ
ncbi:glycosyltransferase [Selenomonas sp. KH1T6]|uniref:glycosyltransferase n=1 Tax=Selenomonas sp. KH1T6 TaxID=3158784 RepID=UPI0008A7AB02|nr:Glycosyl transferase family 2 [Selenomonas ruminantium]